MQLMYRNTFFAASRSIAIFISFKSLFFTVNLLVEMRVLVYNLDTYIRITMSILHHWPMKESAPRKSQETTLKWIEKLPLNIKYIIAEIPVGGGKSPIGIAMSSYLNNSLGSAYILTPQKILQKQYEDSFPASHIGSLYGKANYICESKMTNCDIGSAIKPHCGDCTYKNAYMTNMKKPNVVLNYTLALLMFKYMSTSNLVVRKKLMVLDECHTLENHLTEFESITISERRCKQIDCKWISPSKAQDAFKWITDVYMSALIKYNNNLHKQVKEIEHRLENGGPPASADIQLLNKYKDIQRHLEEMNVFSVNQFSTVENKFVFINDKTYFKFKHVYGKDAFHSLIKPMAEKFLFMSSTVLDKNQFCNDLGIPVNETEFISLDSEFDVKNRPVIYMPTAKMTYGWDSDNNKSEREKMISKIKDICLFHKADNGIIHTANYQVSDWLVDNLEGQLPQRVIHHGQQKHELQISRDEIIDEFVTGSEEPKLLISPSITEGLDLKYEKGRFAIFAKVPYPYLGDAWVKRRMDLSKSWYTIQAIIAMIQGSGRIVRAHDDWGYVYILDSAFGNLLNMNKNKFPKWWLDSITIL